MDLRRDVLLAMIEYDRGSRQRINHLMKVYGYASLIARAEGVDERTQRIVDVASITHDIGIRRALEVYHSSNGKYQEELGPAEAQRLLAPMGMAADELERVKWLIGHHHTYEISEIDHQILVEADFLVNLDEGHSDEATIARVKRDIFRTQTGLTLLNRMFGV